MGIDNVRLLEREVYTESEAARLLGMPPSTLHYWLQGGLRNRRRYPPIIRQEPTDSKVVTWGEFVEAGLLRAYRGHKVPMEQLRSFIAYLRDQMGVPYPLAHARPWITGKELLHSAQEAVDLEPDFWLVSNAQLVLTPVAREFFKQVTWEGDVAAAYRPQPDSPVVVDPRVRFGRPSIGGVSTEAIAAALEAGETAEEAAADFGLTTEQVRSAYEFEATAYRAA